MNTRALTTTLAVIVILILGGYVAWNWNSGTIAPEGGFPLASSTPQAPDLRSLTLAGGEISLSYSADYGLATTSSQVLVHSYIPPCDENFDYCLYYNGGAYTGTNFESAGLRIDRRSDLATEQLCLTTPPSGFTNAQPAGTNSGDEYSTSVFPASDAAAGHVAQSELYRLFVRQSSSCYEFEARIGNSQFANYPSGTIGEFTDTDRGAMQASLMSVLGSAKLSDGTAIVFPVPAE